MDTVDLLLRFRDNRSADMLRTIGEDMGVGAISGPVAANNAGGGKVAALGIGPSGEPGMTAKGIKKYKAGNQLPSTSLLVKRKPAALAEVTVPAFTPFGE